MDKLPEMVQIAQDIEELQRAVQKDDDTWLGPAATHRIAKQMGALLVALKLQAADIKRLTPLAELGAAVSKMEIGHSLNHDLAYVTLVDAVGGWQVVDEYDAMGRAEILGKGPTLRDAMVESGLMEVSNDN